MIKKKHCFNTGSDQYLNTNYYISNIKLFWESKYVT